MKRTIFLFSVFILPIVILVADIIAERFFLNEVQKRWLLSENGPFELAQFGILVTAAIVAFTILITMNRSRDRLLTAWVVLAFLCCVYVAGEEVSWGQWFLDWQTPAEWARINDQGETNLHNTSTWLDQKPRMLLAIGVFAGGILFPLLRRFRPNTLPKRFDLFYPTNAVIVIAVTAAIAKSFNSICRAFDLYQPFYRASEVQEFFYFMFVLVYLVILRGRIKQQDQATA